MSKSQFCIYAVEDDEDDRIIIEAALKPFSDCEVTFFEEGESLLAKLLTSPEENLPDFILLDLDMPRVNGYEVIQTLRTTSSVCAIPILVLSGSMDQQTVLTVYKLGANSFMSKPDTFTKLGQLFKATYEFWLKAAIIPRNAKS